MDLIRLTDEDVAMLIDEVGAATTELRGTPGYGRRAMGRRRERD